MEFRRRESAGARVGGVARLQDDGAARGARPRLPVAHLPEDGAVVREAHAQDGAQRRGGGEVAVLVQVAGVAVVVYGSAGTPEWSPLGDLLAIGALFAWTGYFIASKQVRRQLNAFEYLTGMVVVATIAIAPFALL